MLQNSIANTYLYDAGLVNIIFDAEFLSHYALLPSHCPAV